MKSILSAPFDAAGVAAVYCGPDSPLPIDPPYSIICSSAMGAVSRAIGATVAGHRAAVCVGGPNLISTLGALAALSYTGCHRGLVVITCDGFRSASSGTELDSRPAASLAELPLVEPRTADETAPLLLQCFAWSESIGIPVMLRLLPEHFESNQDTKELWPLPQRIAHFLRKHNRWVTAPHIAFARHRSGHDRLRKFARTIESSPFDSCTKRVRTGVVTTGITYDLGQELERMTNGQIDQLSLSSISPLPTKSISVWLQAHDQVIIVENGGAFVEDQLKTLAHDAGIATNILGQGTRHMPLEGKPQLAALVKALTQMDPSMDLPELADNYDPYGEPDAMCGDSPFYPAILALQKTLEEVKGREHYVIAAEPGPLAGMNEAPLELVDVRYARGTSMGLAEGLRRASTHQIICLTDRVGFLNEGLATLTSHHAGTQPITTLLFWDDQPEDAFDLAALMNALHITWQEWDTRTGVDTLEQLLRASLDSGQDALIMIRHRTETNQAKH